MNDLQREQVRKANEQMLDSMAERVAEVMIYTHGLMKAWPVDEVKQQLTMSLMALAAHPESDQTHGLLSLERMPGSTSDYMIRINLGVLQHFSED